MSDLARTIEERAVAVRSLSDALLLSSAVIERMAGSPVLKSPSERDVEGLVRDALDTARRMAGIAGRLDKEADRMAPVTDATAAARVDAMLRTMRVQLDYATDALMHLDADISDPKGELVQVYAHLDGARHRLREIMEE